MENSTPGWFERRTGLAAALRDLRCPRVRLRPRWRLIWFHTALLLFVVQGATGLAMMTTYSPATSAAWGSVWHIQTQISLGWLVRGVHHFGSQALVVVLAVHVLQTIWFAAYRAPWEVAWWASLAMLLLVASSCVTGWLLPWDERGYWAVQVPANIVGLTPGAGPALRRLMLGGDDIGQATLTRFHAAHVLLLPVTFACLAAGYAAMGRRLSRMAASHEEEAPRPDSSPSQRGRDAVAFAIAIAVLLWLAFQARTTGDALLTAPADPSRTDYPARPEWYFLFLFQWLKLFDGLRMEVVGAIILPAALALLLVVLPFLDRAAPSPPLNDASRLASGNPRTLRPRRGPGRVIAVALASAYCMLLLAALREDRRPETSDVAAAEAVLARGGKLSPAQRRILRAGDLHAQRKRASALADRALKLAAGQGIPPDGAMTLLARDPMTQGPRLFAQHCASCHRFDGHDGLGKIPVEPAVSSDLGGFGGQAWIRGLLRDPADPHYFGLMINEDGAPAHTRMIEWRADIDEDTVGREAQAELERKLDAVAAYLAAEGRRPGLGATLDEAVEAVANSAIDAAAASADSVIRAGRAFFLDECNECHSYQGQRSGTRHAPEMFGYGGVEWLRRMIAHPADDALYRSTGREPALMPSFRERLTDDQIHLLAAWLADDPMQSDPQE